MDQLTHTVRRSNWINIIRQCHDRPTDTTAKHWLAENDISKNLYYYWLRKICREVCEQEELQEVTNPSDLFFVVCLGLSFLTRFEIIPGFPI